MGISTEPIRPRERDVMNALAQDARSEGRLILGPELLPAVLAHLLHPTPLLVSSGATSSRCAGDGLWTLDLRRRYRELRYQVESSQVTIGTGLTMAELLEGLRSDRRALPIGLSGLPGSGFLLTGGMGPLSRSQGLAMDHIQRIEGVWGNGEPFNVHRDHVIGDERAASYWRGLLGAAPFLAVVTGLELRTHPIEPLAVLQERIAVELLPNWIRLAEQWPSSASLQWSWGDYVEIYAVQGLPDGCTSDLLPALAGDAAEICADQLSLPAFGRLTTDRQPLPSHCEVLGRLGQRWGEEAESVVDHLRELMMRRPHPSCRISAQQLGGATGTVESASTSFIHRNAEWKPWITAAWTPEDRAGRQRSLDWMEHVSEALMALNPGVHLAQLHDHLPFHDQELKDAFGSWLPSLKQLKAELDPDQRLCRL